MKIASGLLARLIPQSAGLSEDERDSVARQGLLAIGSGLLASRSGGNFGAALGDGIQSGLLAINRGVDASQDQAYKRAMLENNMIGGASGREWAMLTKGLSEEDKMAAQRVKLGLDPRAVTGAAKIQDVTGADNVTRQAIFDPMTQSLRVFDGQEWVPAGPGNMPQRAAATAASQAPTFQRPATGNENDAMAQAYQRAYDSAAARGLDDQAASDEAARVVNQSMQAPPAPAMPQVNPGMFVSAPKQVTAGQVAAAEANARNASDFSYLGPTLAAKTDAAIREADGATRAKGAAEADIKREGDAFKRTKDANEVLTALDGAESILRAGRATGSGAGASVDKAAAFFGQSTVGAQDAARLKPIASTILQKVPRFEGPQSDKDVASYKEAAGNLADETLPRETRLAAASELRRLNQKYLSQQAATPAAPRAAGGSTAPRRLKFNPATGEIE